MNYSFSHPCDSIKIEFTVSGKMNVIIESGKSYFHQKDNDLISGATISKNEYLLSEKDFTNAFNAIKKIDPGTFIDYSDIMGLDGYSVELKYGNSISNASFYIWQPNDSSIHKNLNKYNGVILLLLKYANLDPLIYYP
jgi:hypothetical protein